MNKLESKTGPFVPSKQLLCQDDCIVFKYCNSRNVGKLIFFKDLFFFFKKMLATTRRNTLLIDDSLKKFVQ